MIRLTGTYRTVLNKQTLSHKKFVARTWWINETACIFRIIKGVQRGGLTSEHAPPPVKISIIKQEQLYILPFRTVLHV